MWGLIIKCCGGPQISKIIIQKGLASRDKRSISVAGIEIMVTFPDQRRPVGALAREPTPDDLRTGVEGELDWLRRVPIVELRARWRAAFKSEPPKAFGPDLLRRSIAYKIQENAYGGLDPATARLLKQLIG